MSNPLKTELLFPRRHTVCYRGKCIEFWSRAKVNSYLGPGRLLIDAWAALNAEGVYKHPDDRYKGEREIITIDGAPPPW